MQLQTGIQVSAREKQTNKPHKWAVLCFWPSDFQANTTPAHQRQQKQFSRLSEMELLPYLKILAVWQCLDRFFLKKAHLCSHVFCFSPSQTESQTLRLVSLFCLLVYSAVCLTLLEKILFLRLTYCFQAYISYKILGRNDYSAIYLLFGKAKQNLLFMWLTNTHTFSFLVITSPTAVLALPRNRF